VVLFSSVVVFDVSDDCVRVFLRGCSYYIVLFVVTLEVVLIEKMTE